MILPNSFCLYSALLNQTLQGGCNERNKKMFPLNSHEMDWNWHILFTCELENEWVKAVGRHILVHCRHNSLRVSMTHWPCWFPEGSVGNALYNTWSEVFQPDLHGMLKRGSQLWIWLAPNIDKLSCFKGGPWRQSQIHVTRRYIWGAEWRGSRVVTGFVEFYGLCST